jgi:DNA-binding response OmpR family regulator
VTLSWLTTAEAALREVCHSTEAFDVILVDQNLPRMNGLELIGALMEIIDPQSVPILLLTSSDAPNDI